MKCPDHASPVDFILINGQILDLCSNFELNIIGCEME